MIRALALTLFLWASTAGAVAIPSLSQAEQVCEQWAAVAERIADLRDAGVRKIDVLDAIDRAVKAGKYPPKFADAMRPQIAFVYRNAKVPPADISRVIQAMCIAEMTSVTI